MTSPSLNVSPRSSKSRMMPRTYPGIGPSWSGVESAHSQICRPSASSSATPKSSDSRMIDEYAMRVSLCPTSRAMLSSAPAMTRAVIGSILPSVGSPRSYSMTSTIGAFVVSSVTAIFSPV